MLYDVLPAKKTTAVVVGESIYESRRYSDTCATVVTIPSGKDEFADRRTSEQHVYSMPLGDDDCVYEEVDVSRKALGELCFSCYVKTCLSITKITLF